MLATKLTPLLWLLCGISGLPSARADTTIEIVPHPIVIEAARLGKTPPAERDRQAQAVADAWVRDFGSTFPVMYAGAKARTDSAPETATPAVLGKLIFDVMHFANDVTSQSRSFESDFKIQFLHAISERAPGFAWFVTAERTGFDLSTIAGFREGGGAGVQIPLLGSNDLWIKDGHGQIALRIMPLAGNFEQVEVGPDPDHRVAAPGSGIVLRPSAELEATYQLGGIQPGIRFLAQPRLLQPNEARMIAEVYINMDFETGSLMLNKISITPRCMIDFSNDIQPVPGPNAAAYAAGYKLLNKAETCSISASFAFGM